MSTSDEATRSDETAATLAEETSKLSLDVEITDVGACKKHVRVRVPKEDINSYYNEAVGEMIDTAEVPGFRIGKVPRELIRRKFRKELYNQCKQRILINSLEQLAEDHDLDPINEPNLDLENIEISGDKDFEYEFDVEVRPAFDVPDYSKFKIERPSREITDEDVDRSLYRFLEQYAHFDKHDGPASAGDVVVADVKFYHNGALLREMENLNVRIKPTLNFHDAQLTDFDKFLAGVSAGETRETTITISREAETIELRGEDIAAKWKIKEVKKEHLPALDREFFDRIDIDSKEQLRNELRNTLERQITYQQRQSAREQVLDKITDSADWDLPEELVMRQAENALRREMLEMQQAGFTTQQIKARENQMRQQAVSVTTKALKEHFVLDKIATEENIEVSTTDIEMEITLMAMQSGENPRRVRARLHKSGMIENLEAQIRERNTIDFILEKAKYEDVPMDDPIEDDAEAVSYSVCKTSADVASSDTLSTDVDEEEE